MGEFDPAAAVTFDMAFGHVHLDGAPHRVLVPAETLLELALAAGEDALADLGHALGEPMGRRVGTRLAEGDGEGEPAERRKRAVRAARPETVVSQLSGELALAGLGALSAERWGRAIVWVVDQSPFGEGGDPLVAHILQGALRAMVDSPARMVPLQREGVRARFLVVSGAAVEDVRTRLAKGDHWSAVIAAMHTKGEPS